LPQQLSHIQNQVMMQQEVKAWCCRLPSAPGVVAGAGAGAAAGAALLLLQKQEEQQQQQKQQHPHQQKQEQQEAMAGCCRSP
jgi:flagellar biosynthesis component FlhA